MSNNAIDRYDGIIFDYGGVLVFHQSETDQAEMAQVAGIPLHRFLELYWADRLDYDKGQDAADYWNAIARKGGVKLTSTALDRLRDLDSQSWMHYDPVMWEWLEQLRAGGKRIAILSNMPQDLGEALRKNTDRLDYFDQVTLSYSLQTAKPEPHIYHSCLRGLGTAPERTLFFDDRIVNVEAAQALGIEAVQFTTREEIVPRFRH